ncbi:hypothetical protein [Thermostichus vulcanus]|uniref:Uncharacterized protein n=1 Tax=Thermostichus vulcanus str. 'Rupite' TaxID=2813851 RepID=A0ABT0C8S2_THEVL|nr:hypothetical protein [Thermostichus vulcanus]MCJ2542193.1 hypothetical protein [Thermostichus vulcanus str. 'Rupite']
MLYLARVYKKGLFGQAELQLLAYQTPDRIWSAVRKPETVTSSEASAYNVGVLLLVEVSEERRVQRVEEAAMKLVEMLHSLSQAGSLMDLSEIESWRQSLTRQSQELSRREAEVAARQDQLEQWEINLRQRQSP